MTDPPEVTCVGCGRTASCVRVADGTVYRPVTWRFDDEAQPRRGTCPDCQFLGLDPAERMRFARRLAAFAIGVDELPAEADVEMALDAEGTIHVRGSVVAKGSIQSVTVPIGFKSDA